MTRQFFGTDGVRGLVNTEPMTAEIALKLGMAAGRVFLRGDHRHRVVIGKDTRLSGYMIEPALTAGFVSVGMDVILLGPVPTPAVGMLVRSLRADMGVMISASHNPFHDNGVKLFGPDGYKLSDDKELEIEALLQAANLSEALAAPDALGRAQRLEDARARYIEFAKATFPKRLRLDGLKVVVDSANGAAYKAAPAILWELGAEVVEIGANPNGFNINEGCGSTDIRALSAKVVEEGAHIGVALDGDADRVIIIDEAGRKVDGDQLMALIGASWAEHQRLRGGGVVSTVMSNLGLERFLESKGLTLERTQVGDRYVVERMREGGFNVGGEQSGHIVLNDFTTTGDGAVAALQVLAEVIRREQPVSEVCHLFDPLPQELKNVRYNGASPLESADAKAAIEAAETRLNGCGRLLIRKSGTEPVIRVMAEAEDAALVRAVVAEVADALERQSSAA